ncbi:MAG: hypothetical protein K2X69_11710 [Silvanigrellaceae bacterium]|nr:hypothetical protein [Silvanigrellaceae bacterium]
MDKTKHRAKKQAITREDASHKASKLLTILEPISKNIEMNEAFNRKVAKLGILVNSNLITK